MSRISWRDVLHMSSLCGDVTHMSSLCGGVLGAHCDRSLWSQVDATVNSQYVASLQLALSAVLKLGNKPRFHYLMVIT